MPAVMHTVILAVKLTEILTAALTEILAAILAAIFTVKAADLDFRSGQLLFCDSFFYITISSGC